MSRKFFKNAVYLTIVEFLLKLKGFVFIPLMSRSFGATNYGMWCQVGVLVAMLTPILMLGTDFAILRYLPGQSLNEQKKYYSAWCYFLIAMACVVYALLLSFRTQIAVVFFGRITGYVFFIPLAGAMLCANMAVGVLRNRYRIDNDAKMYGAIAVFQAFLELSALIIAFLRKATLYQLIIYILIADFIIILWTASSIMRKYGWGKPDFSVIGKLLKYGLPCIPAGYAIWGLNSMDRLFLVKYSDMTAVGIYGMAYGLGYMLLQMTVSPIWNMYPNMAAELYNTGKHDELQKLFERSIKVILLLTLPSIAGIYVLGERVLLIFATKDFIAGAHIISIITTSYLFLMLATYYEVALGLIHKQYLSTVSISIACGVNLVLNILLIPRYGIFGAAIATFLAFFSQLVLSFLFAVKLTDIKTEFGYPAMVAVVSVLMGTLLYLLNMAMPSGGIVPFIVLILSGAVIYFALLFIFRLIDMKIFKSTVNFFLTLLHNKDAGMSKI